MTTNFPRNQQPLNHTLHNKTTTDIDWFRYIQAFEHSLSDSQSATYYGKHAKQSDTFQSVKWYLLGTLGCHLCEEAQKLLRLCSQTYPITWQDIDIAHDDTLLTAFATNIPVLVTPKQCLHYPFSVLDLQRIYADSV